MMAHAIGLAQNELGTFDILWGGYCCSPDLYAYRYDNGSWVNVSEKYPQSQLSTLLIVTGALRPALICDLVKKPANSLSYELPSIRCGKGYWVKFMA